MTDQLPACFVIGPIGPSGSAIRESADRLLQHVIRPAIEQFGFNALRADSLPGLEEITSHVIRQVIEAPLVIADLTGGNANVFYELALRHATRRPVVALSEVGSRIPFDVAAFRVVQVDTSAADGLEAGRKTLAERVRGILDVRTLAETPVSRAVPQWTFSVSQDLIPREIIDSLILTYLEFCFSTSGFRRISPDQQLEQTRHLVNRLYRQLDVVTRCLQMPEPNTHYSLEEKRWKAGSGEE